MTGNSDSQRVIVLTPTVEEAKNLAVVMTSQGVDAVRVANFSELCRELEDGIGAAVIAREVLTSENSRRLEVSLERARHAASDFLLVILADHDSPQDIGGSAGERVDAMVNAAYLERFPSAQTLVSTVKFGLRSRTQQFALRKEITQLELMEGQLDLATATLGGIVTEQTETLRLLRDIATAANSAESVDEALSFALAQICQYAGWSFGHAYLASAEEPDALLPLDALHETPIGRFRTIHEAIRRERVWRGQGLPGRVFATGRPEWTSAILDELDDRRLDLGGHSPKQAAAFPIMARTEVVGVIEFFADDEKDPGRELLMAMSSVGTILGRVVERERAERALRENLRLTRKISETSPTMIRIFDGRLQRYVYINGRTAQFFGLSPQDGTEVPWSRLQEAIHPDDVEQFRRAKSIIGQPGRRKPVTWQGRFRNAAGEFRWLRTWSVVFTRTDDGDPREVLSISIDVTDEIETEEKLRRTERLTSIGTLAAGLAHEINNPLASVIMTGQLLRRRQLGSEIEEMLDDLIRDAKRCARIVRNVQRFARQEPSERLQVDINEIIEAAQEMSHQQVNRAGVRLRLELADESLLVLGDATELEQVLVNLISNAAIASKRDDEVQVISKRVNGRIRVSVRDRGSGMSPDILRQVFDPFFTTRASQGGAGLGLSIAHGIIEDHGGDIDVRSEVGKGTTVSIVLPGSPARFDNAE